MSSNTTDNLLRRTSTTIYQTITRVIGSTAIFVGVLVLYGWFFDIALYKSVIPGANTMAANSAIGFICLGLSILLFLTPCEFIQNRPLSALIGKICLGFVLLIGLLTLAEQVFNLTLGIDEFLIQSEPDLPNLAPGRMSLMSALNFSLLGFVLFFGNTQKPINQLILEYAALFVLAIASLALLGYLYHSGALYKISFMSSMAMHTALLFWLLAIAVLLAHPRLCSESWRYGLAAIVVILEFGLRLKLTAWFGSGFPPFLLFFPGIIFIALLTGFGPGLFTTALSAMVVAIWVFEPVGLLHIESPVHQVSLALYCGIGGVICALVRLYHRNQQKAAAFDRELAIQESRRETEFLGAILDSSSQPFAVGYRDGRLGRTNRAFEELLGYSAGELQQLDWGNVLTPSQWRDFEEEQIAELIRTGEPIRYEKEYIRKDGVRVPVELLVHLVRDAQGQPDYFYAFITDITERKQAEESLWVSEERYRSLFDGSLDAIFSIGADGRFVTANNAALRLSGKTLEEIKSVHFLDLCAPDQRESAADAFRASLCRQCLTLETAFIGANGVRRELFISGAPAIVDGEVVGVSCIARDMTERKRAETALLESENRFRQVTESLPQLVWTCNADGSCDYLSPQWCKYTGIPEAPQLGIGWMEQLHPEDSEGAITTWQATAAQGSDFIIEYRIRRYDGEYRWFHTLAVPLRDESGAVVKWFGSNTDIQGLKEADIAIRESEARLHFALEMCNTGAWEVDLETHLTYRSIEHARIFGYADLSSEWTSDIFLEHVVEEDRPEIAALLEDAFRTGNERRFECRIRRTDGEVRWIMAAGRFRISKLGNKSKVAVGIVQDITERKLAQEALELLNVELEDRVKMRTDELTALNQSLESFVYSVSHDLKTPLRGIEGYSRLLQQDYGAILDGEGNLFLSNIREGINRMNDLIDDLLAYSRMNRRKLDAEQVNVNLLVDNIVTERKEDITKRGVIIEINLPPLTICADADGLALVLRNLVQNALKFSQHNPAPHIEIGATQDENTVTLWIKDNGIGFDMKYVERIFEIFQRLHRLEDYPGTGIGLALVKTAMQRMNGKVWAESESGHGATFFLSLKSNSKSGNITACSV